MVMFVKILEELYFIHAIAPGAAGERKENYE